MFERFDDESRQAVVHAQSEARRFGDDHIGTEHLLVGVARSIEDQGVGDGLPFTSVEARAAVASVVGDGRGWTEDGHIPFTPAVTATFELAFREAIHLGHDSVTGAHLLLGLAGVGGDRMERIFEHLHTDPAALRRSAMSLLKAGGVERRGGFERGARGTPGASRGRALPWESDLWPRAVLAIMAVVLIVPAGDNAWRLVGVVLTAAGVVLLAVEAVAGRDDEPDWLPSVRSIESILFGIAALVLLIAIAS